MNKPIHYIGVGKYVQEEYALDKAGEECRLLGKKAFVLGGKTALGIVHDRLEASLAEKGISCEFEIFSGFCSPEKIDAYTELFLKSGADFVIGVGGGRAIDTAKGITYRTNACIMCIPTSVAQCACYANVIILYRDNGDPLPYAWHLIQPVNVILVDTDIIIRKCPVRMLSTGIADSMAKLVEIDFLRTMLPAWSENFLATYSYQMANNIWQLNMQHAKRACIDAANGLITPEVEAMICMSLMLTGLSSGLAHGCRQIAFAHNLYYATCIYCKDIQQKYMHGELVSMGLPLQMMLNRAKQEDIDRLIQFLYDIGAPVYPKDIGFAPTAEIIEDMLSYCYEHMPFLSEEDKNIMNKGMFKFWFRQAAYV